MLNVTPSGLGLDRIQAYAEEFGQHHPIHKRPETDLNLLIRTIGGTVDVTSHKYVLVIKGRSDFIIHLPEMTTRVADRYTTACQLGHYFLHYRYSHLDEVKHKPYKFPRYGVDAQLHFEAAGFARALLLPSSQFKEMHEILSGDVDRIADLCKVPEFVVRQRVAELGLILQEKTEAA